MHQSNPSVPIPPEHFPAKHVPEVGHLNSNLLVGGGAFEIPVSEHLIKYKPVKL
jgi:hypothetical protein